MPLLHAIREPPVRLLELPAIADDDELAILGAGGPGHGAGHHRRAGSEDGSVKGSPIERQWHRPTPFIQDRPAAVDRTTPPRISQ
jgi:hypothetical protein